MPLTRRRMLGWMGMAAAGALLDGRWIDHAAAQPQETPTLTRWQRSANHKRELTKNVTWLTHEPLAFLIRRGDHGDNQQEIYRRMLEPENIKQMAAAGVTYGRIFFYKGFGIQFERPAMALAKAAADLMHQLGMKVSLYVGGTMFTETLYQEIPHARDWEQRDQWGNWVPYGIQTYRHYACPNEPAYRDYLKSVLKIGIEEIHADQFAFDNIMLQAEPHSCRCPRCSQAFTEFLRERYPTQDAALRRFGIANVDWIRANQWDSPDQPSGLTVLDDPVLQEWTRFRCRSLGRYADDLNDYVKSRNPHIDVMFNIKGIFSYNRQWANAVYHPDFAGHMDALAFDTGGYNEHIDAVSGALVSQIRSYKMARRLGAGCEDSFGDEIRAAVHMSFGYQKPVGQWIGAPFGSGAQAEFTPCMEFFREYNDRYYTGADNIADVAVLRTWASMAYSISAAHVPATLMEQVLIQHKIPFDLLFEEQLDRLSRYGAVILAGQECLSDDQAKTLLDYARGGGSLILAANTAEFDQWRQKRGSNPFPPPGPLGKGQVIFIPEIVRADTRPRRPGGAAAAADQDAEPGATLARGERLTPPQWVLPRNHQAIADVIAAALPGGLSLVCDAPLTTVAELLQRPATKETIVHFVNFDRDHEVGPIAVTIAKPLDERVKSVRCFSPDADDPIDLPFEESAGRVKFTLPSLRAYAMAVLSTASNPA